MFNIYGKIELINKTAVWDQFLTDSDLINAGCLHTVDYSYKNGIENSSLILNCPNSIVFNYTLNGMPTSDKETRVKSKFFSLMIYAGYPA